MLKRYAQLTYRQYESRDDDTGIEISVRCCGHHKRADEKNKKMGPRGPNGTSTNVNRREERNIAHRVERNILPERRNSRARCPLLHLGQGARGQLRKRERAYLNFVLSGQPLVTTRLERKIGTAWALGPGDGLL